MKPKHWLPLYVADYLADTMHLTTTQHGAYLLLILAYWRKGSPLNNDADELAAIAKCDPKEWQKLSKTVAKFFTITPTHWTHKRVDAELENASVLMTERSKAGSKGAAKRWQTHGKGHGKPHGKRIAKPLAKGMANTMANEKQTPWQNDAPSPSPLHKVINNNSSVAPRKGAAKGNGVDYSDPENRKQRWIQKLTAPLVEQLGEEQAMATLEAFNNGDPKAKHLLDLLSKRLEKQRPKGKAP